MVNEPLHYDNIFESIESNQERALKLKKVSDALIAFDTTLEEAGISAERRKQVIMAAKKEVFDTI